MSPYDQKGERDAKKIIVLVEDNPNDEALTLKALKKNNIANEIVIARDGSEALDFFLVKEPLPAVTMIRSLQSFCWT